MKTIFCAKCHEELAVEIAAKKEQEYSQGKGDSAWWNKYSHVQVCKDGVSTEPLKIDAIYEAYGGLCINHPLPNGHYANQIGLKRKTKNTYVYSDKNDTVIFLIERKKMNKSFPQVASNTH